MRTLHLVQFLNLITNRLIFRNHLCLVALLFMTACVGNADNMNFPASPSDPSYEEIVEDDCSADPADQNSQSDDCEPSSVNETIDDNENDNPTTEREDPSGGGNNSGNGEGESDNPVTGEGDPDAMDTIEDKDKDLIEDENDNCPMVFNPSQLDTDNDHQGDSCDSDDDDDGIYDVEDVDDDGDGLIDIRNSAELDAVRYQLNARGRRLEANGFLNTSGCGNGDSIHRCVGYELVNDINIAAYQDVDDGKGWQPIGYDNSSKPPPSFLCSGEPFTAIFEGNDYVVEGLKIARPTQNCVGLFSQVEGEVRNLHIAASSIRGSTGVGVLAGVATRAMITACSVVSDSAKGQNLVGGLIGRSDQTTVRASSAITRFNIEAEGPAGGLTASHRLGRVIASYAVSNNISGSYSIGGLVGDGQQAVVISSYALSGTIGGRQDNIGGLVGDGTYATIVSSYGVTGYFAEGAVIGGLVGGNRNARIFNSYAISHSADESGAGGLAGFTTSGITASYWDNNITGGFDTSYGRTTEVLQDNESLIYRDWDKPVDLSHIIWADVSGLINMTGWCDSNLDGNLSSDEQLADNRIWDFGSNTDYPAVRCTSASLSQQRQGWHLGSDGRPAIDSQATMP